MKIKDHFISKNRIEVSEQWQLQMSIVEENESIIEVFSAFLR